MIGIITPPMAEVSATGEPETPPNSVQAITLARPRPPRMWPTRLRAKFMILSAMPPCSISSPEKMKNGIARNENTFMPETIIWTAVAMRRPSLKNAARQASPMEKATGTPSSSRTTKVVQRSVSAMSIRSVVRGFAAQHAIEREQGDQDPGDDRREVAPGFGDAQRRDLVAVSGQRHLVASPQQHQREGQRRQRHQPRDPVARGGRQADHQRIEPDVAGVVRDRRRAEHGHRD